MEMLSAWVRLMRTLVVGPRILDVNAIAEEIHESFTSASTALLSRRPMDVADLPGDSIRRFEIRNPMVLKMAA